MNVNEIKKVPTTELVALYNKISGKSIKKFATRAKGEAQVLKLVQADTPQETKPAKIGKRDTYENRIIKVLIQENPKRPESRAYGKFAILLKNDGKTIKDLKREEGKHPSLDLEKGWPATELRWAIKLELVKIINV